MNPFCIRTLLIALLCSGIAACGGGSSSSPGPLAISPGTASIAAGKTQQFTATGGESITWQINGVIGGNSTLGTISAAGLYTAPTQPPTTEPVTVTALSNAMTASATLTVTYSDASIQGTYLAGITEYAGSVNISLIGYFTFDGNGNVSGTVDANTTTAVLTGVSVSGHYVVNPDGSGTLSMSVGSVGNFNLDVTLAAGGLFAVTDATGGKITATLWVPQASVQGVTALTTGTYILSYGGFIPNVASPQAAGAVTATSGGQFTVQELDQNSGGGAAATLETALPGTYTLNTDGRGTFDFTDTQGTHHFVMYAQPGNDFQIMSLDTGTPLTGSLDIQNATTLPTTGDALVIVGNLDATNDPDVMQAQTDFANSTYAGNENDNGATTSISGSGTVQASDSYGRGQLTIPTASGQRSFVYYVNTSGFVNLLENDTLGNLSGQLATAPATVTFSKGHYILAGGFQGENSQAVSSITAILDISSATQISGSETVNSGGTVSTLTVSGTLNFGSNGGTLTLKLSNGTTQQFMVLGINSGEFALLGEDADNISAPALVVQYVPASTS